MTVTGHALRHYACLSSLASDPLAITTSPYASYRTALISPLGARFHLIRCYVQPFTMQPHNSPG